ncbi:MAG: YlbF family regulator [Eubacteriales bacterium]|nr:YlbF family regulator [Eubacteriales bacterium]
MSDVTTQVDELVRAMQNSEDYRKYCSLEEELEKNPELKQLINSYRRRVYEMNASERDLYEETDYVLAEYDELFGNVLAVEYLDAESAVCSMVRRVMDDISKALPVELPY